MKFNRILPAFLLFCIVMGTAASCGNDSSPQPVEKNSTVGETDTEAITTQTETNISLPDAVDYAGDTITILSRLVTGHYCYPYHEFIATEENGDTINDAVLRRNQEIEEKYNVVLEAFEEDDVGVAHKSILAGDNVYDILLPMHQTAYWMSVQGSLLDVVDLPHIDLSRPYWHTAIMNNTSIGEKNYFLTGDLNLSTLNGVGVVYFNQGVSDEYDIPNLYDIVQDGKWTLDAMTMYGRTVTRDLNGDQNMNGDDMWGLTCNGFVWQPLFAGTGSSIISKDDSDLPVLEWGSSKNIDRISKLVEFLNDDRSVILVNQFPELEDAGGWGNASIQMFSEDRALFWIEIIYGIHQLRDMETDFGLLPIPKFDETQEEYTSYVHAGWTSTVCVPITNQDFDRTGRILEDLAYQSHIIVRPAYYDVTLKDKISRDDASGKMLDIIYSNINLDLALVMGNLPIDGSMRSFVIENKTDFVSTIESLKEKCEKIIKSNLDSFSMIESE